MLYRVTRSDTSVIVALPIAVESDTAEIMVTHRNSDNSHNQQYRQLVQNPVQTVVIPPQDH